MSAYSPRRAVHGHGGHTVPRRRFSRAGDVVATMPPSSRVRAYDGIDAWPPRAAARRPDAPRRPGRRDGDAAPTRRCSRRGAAAAARAALRARAWRAGRPGGIALPAGRGVRGRAARVPAARRRRGPGRPAARRRASAPRAPRRCAVTVERAARRRERGRRRVAATPRPRRGRRRHPHLGHDRPRRKPVELTYGNWLWSALGSAVALGLDPAERWLCALPLAHVGGLSILVRSRDLRRRRRSSTGASTDARAARAAASGSTLVSLVPTTLARLLDAGLRDPPALRCALIGGGPIPPALLERARGAGVPVEPTYGLTEACSQVHRRRRPAALLHRVALSRRRRDPRRRPDRRARRARRRRLPAHAATSAPRRATAACGSPAARRTRSSPAGRTSRRRRSRPCSRRTRPSPRRRSTRGPTSSGARRSSRPSCCGGRRRDRRRAARPRARARWPRFKVPKDVGFADDAPAHAAPASSA